MSEKELIAANAEEVNILNKAVHDTWAKRNQSNADWMAWQNACDKFHANYYPRLFYPGGKARLRALRQSDRNTIETAINFLEVDPFYFRSGYIKEYIWKWIVRCPLTEQDINRLHQVALQYVEKRIEREFWYMCRAMTRLPRNAFWEATKNHMNSDNPFVRIRASYLHAYSQSIEIGERLRLKVYQEVLHQKWGTS